MFVKECGVYFLNKVKLYVIFFFLSKTEANTTKFLEQNTLLLMGRK